MAIEPRPAYPPRPVGVAVKRPGRRAKYYAWGHPAGNNCTLEEARRELAGHWANGASLLGHSQKFDLDVAAVHMDLPLPPPGRVEDTMLLAFLDDPHSKQIGLKPLGERLLGRAPVERDALREWILENVPGARSAKARWGAHISKAPGDLVARYAADGDATITETLWKFLRPKVKAAGMDGAYLRERRLIPLLLDMERRGVHVDLPRLQEDVVRYGGELARADRWIRARLGVRELNVDANDDLADAVERAGKLRPEGWELTEKGNRSVSKENFALAVEDRALAAVVAYRSLLATCLGTFMRPWLETAEGSGGRIFTQWNSTAQPEGGGTRTGRFSATPNFQNIPTLDKMQEVEAALKAVRVKFLPIPRVRGYIIAAPGKVLIGRDFSSQEPRVLAHFEDGQLCQAYRDDPRMDVYVWMMEVLRQVTGIVLHADTMIARKRMKTLLLALIYGLGIGHLAERLECSVVEARATKAAFLRTFPGIDEVAKDLKRRARADEPMMTWGGRLYHVEDPKIIKGQLRDFGYRMINHLMQGSSADITKEAMLRYWEDGERAGDLILTVHDELAAEVDEGRWKDEMVVLRRAMDEIPGIDVPMVSEGEWGRNWNDMEACA